MFCIFVVYLLYICCIFVVFKKRWPMRPFVFVSLLYLCCIFVVSLLYLPLHFSGSQVIEYHWVTEQNFVSRRAVNTKYKYHISWNLAVPFTVTLILRTYTSPPTKGLGISINRPDKPGRSDAGGCRPSSASLRFPARASFWMGRIWKVPAYWF